MLPLRDNIPSSRLPLVNVALIVVNVLAFFYELSLGPKLEAALYYYGLVPLKYSAPARFPGLELGDLVAPFLSCMFLHGGWMHLLSNMWTLWIFGDNVEDRLGHAKYLAFYLLCGLAASGTQLIASWGSGVPTIGASGAVAGVMGAYFLLYPHARVLTLVPVFGFLRVIEIPATLFLGFWFLSQFFSGVASLSHAGRVGGIAWWAHIGGFAAGMGLKYGMLGRRRSAGRA